MNMLIMMGKGGKWTGSNCPQANYLRFHGGHNARHLRPHSRTYLDVGAISHSQTTSACPPSIILSSCHPVMLSSSCQLLSTCYHPIIMSSCLCPVILLSSCHPASCPHFILPSSCHPVHLELIWQRTRFASLEHLPTSGRKVRKIDLSCSLYCQVRRIGCLCINNHLLHHRH